MTYNVFAGTLVVKPYSTQPQQLQHRPNLFSGHMAYKAAKPGCRFITLSYL